MLQKVSLRNTYVCIDFDVLHKLIIWTAPDFALLKSFVNYVHNIFQIYCLKAISWYITLFAISKLEDWINILFHFKTLELLMYIWKLKVKKSCKIYSDNIKTWPRSTAVLRWKNTALNSIYMLVHLKNINRMQNSNKIQYFYLWSHQGSQNLQQNVSHRN